MAKFGEQLVLNQDNKQNEPKLQDTAKVLAELPPIAGLTTQMTERGQYRIVHESGAILPFVLQWPKEAADMKLKLAKVMTVQDTCIEKKSLLDTCKIYSEKSFDNYTADLFIDNNPYVIGPDSLILQSEEIESSIRGVNKKHSIRTGGISPFAEWMASFLNTIQDSKVKITKK